MRLELAHRVALYQAHLLSTAPSAARSLVPALPPALFDVDVNVLLLAKSENVPELLEHAFARGLRAGFVPGSSLEDSAEPLAPKIASVALYRGAGVHPFNALQPPTRAQLETLETLVAAGAPSRIVALGECGLDASPGFPRMDAQRAWFQAHLDLAARYRLPLFCHERGAHAEFCDMLRAHQAQHARTRGGRVLVHCFTGTAEELRVYLSMGCYVSVSGMICRKGRAGDQLRRALATHLPRGDRLMIETDAPYMGFPGCRGDTDAAQTPNVPAALPRVLQALAKCLGREEASVARDCANAACEFFNVHMDGD
jgi:TatD DNase family protein